jgi:hypothetical protein
MDLADRVLRQLELGANAVHGGPTVTVPRGPKPDTGWPHSVLRAG